MIVKVCGNTCQSTVDKLAKMGIDTLGFIHHKSSPRNLEQSIRCEKNITKIGVFVNTPIDKVTALAAANHYTTVQLHGDESPAYCEHISTNGLSIIKAFSVDEGFDFTATKKYEQHVDLFLFDTKGSARGGNGVKFNWDLLHAYSGSRSFLLSGGIDNQDPKRIKELMESDLKIAGIDINSKFEIRPGVKDLSKIKSLIEDLKS